MTADGDLLLGLYIAGGFAWMWFNTRSEAFEDWFDGVCKERGVIVATAIRFVVVCLALTLWPVLVVLGAALELALWGRDGGENDDDG